MVQMHKNMIVAIEQILGERLLGVACELRLVDAADFIAFIHTGQAANLRNIVQSSTELHFKPGTLKLAELGEAELGWRTPPTVTLPMEFRKGRLTVRFKLVLAAEKAAVGVESFSVEDGEISPAELGARLIEALDQARMPNRP